MKQSFVGDIIFISIIAVAMVVVISGTACGIEHLPQPIAQLLKGE